MGTILESILLGDNPITFTLSFIINLVLLAAILRHFRPIEAENIRLKDKLDDKDIEIKGLIEDNKKLSTEIMASVNHLSEDIKASSVQMSKDIEKVSKIADDIGDVKTSSKEIESELRSIHTSVENLNTKQTIMQGVLFGQSLFDESVTKVK